jgi:serine protease Do
MSDSNPSVAVGVISARNRNFAGRQDGKVYKGMIQTDAAINPGNSGGPLCNIYGEVIGINTFIFSENGGSIGIGFAIPIDRVKKVILDLIKNCKVQDIYYGFKVQDITPAMAAYMNLKAKNGVIVVQVDPHGPAADAGIKPKDIIVAINDNKISNSNDVELAVSDIYVGDTVRISLIRDGKETTVSMKAKAS